MTVGRTPKIFCIGFHKTGTTSLGEALEQLGYRVTGPNWINDSDVSEKSLEKAMQLVPKFDAFQDNPWPMIYKEMDKAFPGSKFILTVRDTGKWLASIVGHFGTDTTPMREWIYGKGHGCPKGNEKLYISRLERHAREVQDYFKGREQDLLVMNVTEGDGWEKLCPFLGLEVPAGAFPRANVAARRKWINKLLRQFRKRN